MFDELHFYTTEDEAERGRRAMGTTRHDQKIRHLSIQSAFLGYRAKEVYDHVRWGCMKHEEEMWTDMQLCRCPRRY